ncbi:DUF2256 domain-containing protein [Shewanella sp. WXL01]|uniref:DUF2256 domain-containing protein n=1 Tax=Shewanella maritima TaxID=2520507 RepID=A0A411PMA9_9GAMM|nr:MULTISPECIES: DUF2256 domain-containing protein [Shewanella]NKF52728.1 DUF2256 domain-containing protein [Shewanella sp. WXL01]QBF84641.1 DUF2256 domain-containing protein [Shewanella maritima]
MSHKPSNKNQLYKICPVCQRRFDWRKKWQKVWQEVRYCSKRCRGNRQIINRKGTNEAV